MDLNKLKTFVTVAECGSITLAATQLGRTQSAITQQIQILEDELEIKLLERRSSRVFLSPNGEQIFQQAREKISGIESMIHEIKGESSQPEGNLTLGVLNDFGTDFNIGKITGEFCAKFPKINILISVGDTDFIEDGLISNQFDLGIKVVFNRPKMFHQHPITVNQHHLYTSKKYLAKVGKIQNYKALMDLDLIDLKPDFLAIATFLNKNAKNCVPMLKRRQPSIICPNLLVIKEILLSGYGVAMLPEYLANEDKNHLIKLFPKAKSLTGVLDVAYRTNRTLRLCEKLFIEHLCD